MKQHVIRAVGLNKKYGNFHAVKTLNLELDEGDVFGFIGPNGAGKTTTMRMLATLLDPTSGEAYVCGHSIYNRPREIRRLVGYMPDFFGVYDDMKVIEYLEFFAATYRIPVEKRLDICERVLDLVDGRAAHERRHVRDAERELAKGAQHKLDRGDRVVCGEVVAEADDLPSHHGRGVVDHVLHPCRHHLLGDL